MIKEIIIQNFKSLAQVDLRCSNLNILCGLNSMGKSSIIQMLLLLRQSYEKGFLQKDGLLLKGDLIDVGLAKEALYQFAEYDEIMFGLNFQTGDNKEDTYKEWIFSYEKNDESDEYKYSESVIIPYGQDVEIPANLLQLSLFQPDKFRYLSAERWVRNIYEVADYQVTKNRSLGKYGEYTPYYLVHNGAKEEVDASLLYPKTEVTSLEYQVSAWMGEISPGTKVITEKISGINSVKLSYTFSEKGLNTTPISPLNVGFGMTYILPVVVALLSAKPGDILLIENPESHIHPKGQSVIGKLMAKVATLGVQIFVETHSDHIINGVRVAVKEGIPNQLINILFVSKENEMASELENLRIDRNGELSNYPVDFMDEWNNQLLKLL